jgi:hypothetical protein
LWQPAAIAEIHRCHRGKHRWRQDHHRLLWTTSLRTLEERRQVTAAAERSW